jgi:hypothetical protein
MKLPLSIGLGPARGMFNTLLKLGFNRNGVMKNKKITPQEALTLLEKHFKTDLLSIYQEINKFREGIKSLEVYTS